jgi:hypothetical protein
MILNPESEQKVFHCDFFASSREHWREVMLLGVSTIYLPPLQLLDQMVPGQKPKPPNAQARYWLSSYRPGRAAPSIG